MRALLFSCLFVLVCASGFGQPVSFQKHIAPILAASCNACHSGASPQSGLSTATYALLMKGGRRGRAISPGKPAESLLIQYVEGAKQPKMPIGGSLKPQEIALLKRWITEGAKLDAEPAAKAPTPNPPAAKPPPGVLPQVASLAWNRDGSILAAGTYQRVLLLDPSNGRTIRSLGGHADVVRSLCFSPDFALLAAAAGIPGAGGEVTVWDPAAGRLVKRGAAHTDCIYGLAWAPEGKQLATASYDKTVRIWEAPAAVPKSELKEHAEAVFAAVYTKSGKLLATAGSDRSIRIWDPSTGKRLYTLAGHSEAITALAAHPSMDQIASASSDRTVRVWNLKPDGGAQAKVWGGHASGLTDVRYSPDGSLLAAAAEDGMVRIWNIGSEKQTASFQAPDSVLSLAFHPDGKTVAVGCYDGTISLYNVEDGKLKAALIAPPRRAAAQQR